MLVILFFAALSLAPLTSHRYQKYDVLQFYCRHQNNLPILSLYASKLYAYQGSSAESERAFSSAGRMKNSTRSQLKPETLAALVVLKSNGDLLDKKVSNFDSDDNSDFYIEQ